MEELEARGPVVEPTRRKQRTNHGFYRLSCETLFRNLPISQNEPKTDKIGNHFGDCVYCIARVREMLES